MSPSILKKEYLLKNTRVKEDEALSEGRRSASSTSRSRSRLSQIIWEERNSMQQTLSKSTLHVEDEADFALNARRKDIKNKQNQVF